MNTVFLSNLAVLTLTKPAEAARRLMDMKPGREVLWLAFFLAVVLNCMVQLGIDTLVQVSDADGLTEPDPVPLILLKSAGAMMLSILAFLYVGRLFGGTASFDDMMVLTIWLQFLQVAALLVSLLVGLALPFFVLPLTLAIALLSLYITLHFLNEAHQLGSLGKSFVVILLSGLIAVPFVLMLTPSGPA